MSNPHPFYRFDKAWNAGFYPDNKIVSNLTNALAGNLDTWVSTYAIGLTLSEVYAYCKSQMETFNAFPYFGGFSIVKNEIVDSPNYEFNIFIRNVDLTSVDSSQEININGYFNPTTKIVVSAAVLPFTPVAYSGTFSAPAIPVEKEVANALQIVEQNGSAFFPTTYSFDSVSNIATSGLARGMNWTLNSAGQSTRLPADVLPIQNARTFQLSSLSADEKYCISIFEKVIGFSLTDTDITNINNYYSSFTLPSGWANNFAISYDTYNRLFIWFSNGERTFLIIGRFDVAWLWQRFVSDQGSTDLSVFSAYPSTTPLPYEPTISYQWLYGEWYDFDFVEFTSDCYISPEFYAMPAIPGDIWQFNVPPTDGNLIGIDSAQVGLFTESGQFIQQIGSGSIADSCQTQLFASCLIPSVASGCYRLGLYSDPYTTCDMTFTYSLTDEAYTNWIDSVNGQFESANPYISFSISGLTYYVYPITTNTNTALQISGWVNSNIPGMTSTWDEFGIYFSWSVDNLPCGDSYSMINCVSTSEGSCLAVLWGSDVQSCECGNSSFLYSLSNIIKIDASDCFSTILEFWSNDNSMAQGFEYFNGWKQRIRLGINGGGAKPIIEENIYRQSNGVHRRPQNKQDLSVDLHTDFLDEDTKLAIVDATRHPYLVWEGKSIFVKGDIEVATIQDFTTQSSFETLAQVKFQALIQGFQPKNSSCLTC